jgi:hypothetical protein
MTKTTYLVATNGIIAEFDTIEAAQVFATENGAYVAEFVEVLA